MGEENLLRSDCKKRGREEKLKEIDKRIDERMKIRKQMENDGLGSIQI